MERYFEGYLGTEEQKVAARIKIKEMQGDVLEKFAGYGITESIKYEIAAYIHNALEQMAMKEEIPAELWIVDNEVRIVQGMDPCHLEIKLPISLLKWLDQYEED